MGGWARALLLALVASLGLGSENIADLDQDGYPDIAELHSAPEREAFMLWFAAIAEALYTAPPADWKPEDRDCSGLLRYAFVEALKPKTSEWLEKFKYLPETQIPPIALEYPLPVIGRSVFRVAPGAYQREDVQEGRLVGRTGALYLMNYSAVFLGKTPDKARRGDLLFFVHPLAKGSAYHSMVYLGNGRVVYHTGYAPEDGGEVRLLTLETLGKHPLKSWHPVPENPNFLGFFRWKIVDSGDKSPW
jgi:uncharacterized protein YfaT (DUF1175 family)